jgi:hypothetical protein
VLLDTKIASTRRRTARALRSIDGGAPIGPQQRREYPILNKQAQIDRRRAKSSALAPPRQRLICQKRQDVDFMFFCSSQKNIKL